MTMNSDKLLLGRVLVIVAHQDDETSCSVLMQRARETQVVFATDGAPASRFFWGRYGSREEYAEVRRAEALRSLAVVGVGDPVFLKNSLSHTAFQDQELFRYLPSAIEALEMVVEQSKPDVMITPAYEGGHPDHDACSFIVSTVGHRFSLPAWEMPLYHRSPEGTLVYQEFRIKTGSEIVLDPTPSELRKRDQMLRQYVSQPDVHSFVSAQVERFRPQPDYNYSQPPHPGLLNYEAWEWRMTGVELCAAFRKCGLKRTAARSY
jgi:LmbE family N-acetylglucosaminyl deacetylase